jgi:hypothetical protein
MFIDCERLRDMDGNNSIFGCRNEVNGNVREYDALFQKTSPEKLYIRPYIYPSNPNYFEFPSGRFTVALTGRDIVVNGASVKAYTPGGTLETGNALWLLAMNYGTGKISQNSIFKLYRFSLSSPTALLIDLIPALRKSDRTAGLYDKVSKQFFTNDGTGTFGYRVKGKSEAVKTNATTYSLRAPRDPYYVPPSGVYARKVGEAELEVLADTEDATGEGWVWFANTAEAYEHFGIVQDNEELLTE